MVPLRMETINGSGYLRSGQTAFFVDSEFDLLVGCLEFFLPAFKTSHRPFG